MIASSTHRKVQLRRHLHDLDRLMAPCEGDTVHMDTVGVLAARFNPSPRMQEGPGRIEMKVTRHFIRLQWRVLPSRFWRPV